MRRRVTGLCFLCIGTGMILVVVIPTLGWIFTSAIILIAVGCGMFRC